jgi:hypothetical protein
MKRLDGESASARNARRARYRVICSGPGSSTIRDLVSRGAEYNINMLTKTLVTAGAIMVCTHLALAVDKQVSAEATPTPSPPAPLMYLFDQAGIAKPLKDLGINLYGYVEGDISMILAPRIMKTAPPSWDTTSSRIVLFWTTSV